MYPDIPWYLAAIQYQIGIRGQPDIRRLSDRYRSAFPYLECMCPVLRLEVYGYEEFIQPIGGGIGFKNKPIPRCTG